MTKRITRIEFDEYGQTQYAEVGSHPENGTCENPEGYCKQIWGDPLVQLFVPSRDKTEWWCAECFVRSFLSQDEGPWRFLNVHGKQDP